MLRPEIQDDPVYGVLWKNNRLISGSVQMSFLISAHKKQEKEKLFQCYAFYNQ